MTSLFHAKPGVGQNIAWALTKHVNFSKIIDDLWYRDIASIQPGYIKDFQVNTDCSYMKNYFTIYDSKVSFTYLFILSSHQIQMHRRDQHLVTQMIWGRTTHIGCGWTQFPLKDNQKLVYNRLYPGGEYENFFVCNYGVGKYLISSIQ